MAGIILIGYRGTGKTTVGRLLAERLGCALIDSDRLLEEEAGKTIARIFAEEGEEAFRDRETKIVAKLAERKDFFVLATGGGVPIREVNRRNLRRAAEGTNAERNESEANADRNKKEDDPSPAGKQSGLIVWLTAEPATIAARLSGDAQSAATRPALTKLSPTEEIEALLAARAPFYREIADLTVATDAKTPQEIAEAISS